MTTISNALQAAQARISRASAQCGRDPESILLLAVSKTVHPDLIRAAYNCGQRAFGESYVQESLEKIAALRDLDIEWHFIGPLQSNKTKWIAESFAWVHGVERAKIAQRLSGQRPAGLPPLNLCLQVNVSGEASKSGVAPAEVAELAQAVAALPKIKLRGLMTIPEPTDNPAKQRASFRVLRDLRDRLVAQGYALDTLSMGMSGDLEAAIAEGATIVRLGSAIFGERKKA
ncbi:MAG: YggS family pyridoxal phosphate-dependent enzyme [Burkholderiales bacterium]